MKFIIAILIASVMLTSCNFGVNDTNSNTETVTESTTKPNVDDPSSDNLDSTTTTVDKNEPDTEFGDTENNGGYDDNGSTDDNGDITNTPDTPDTLSKITISDYLIELANQEYCNDKDFLNFVATMDNRTVGKIIYASNNGEGDGTFNSPASLEDAIDMAKAGDTVYLRGGEYIFKEAIWLDKSGKAGAYLTIKSYPGEKAVLTTTPENIDKYDDNGEYLFFGLDEGCSYIIFEDLEIYGAIDKYVAAFACYGGGQNHLIFKNLDIHDLGTTKTKYDCNAFLFFGEGKNSINNIMIINTRCHDLTLGYSEAISFAGNCEYCYVIGNEVYNCRNIGIDFYGNAGYCSVEALDQARYCVAAFNTVYNCNSPYADCAGIYVDGGRNCLVEGNLVYNCQYGIEIGSEELNEKYPVTDIIVRNNILKNNTVCTMRIGGYDTKSSGTVMNCLVYNNTFVDNSGDSDIILSKVDGIVLANNIFIGKITHVETEFEEKYIKNLTFINNCFNRDGENFYIYKNDLTVADINALYGKDNFVCNVTLDENYAPSEALVGNKDYAPTYDIYLTCRINWYIGAVERLNIENISNP